MSWTVSLDSVMRKRRGSNSRISSVERGRGSSTIRSRGSSIMSWAASLESIMEEEVVAIVVAAASVAGYCLAKHGARLTRLMLLPVITTAS